MKFWYTRRMLERAEHALYRAQTKKKTERHTSRNMWMQYEVTSPEQNDTKIINFGSVVCFLVIPHTLIL